MGIWEIVVGILVLILSIIMVIVIILQEGHQAGLGTITGGADSFLSKGKARTADAIFARVTKYCAITFFILVVLLNALSFFGITGDNIDKNATSAESSVKSEASKEESSQTEESSKASESGSSDESSSSESSVTSSTESSVASTVESSTASAAESSAETSQASVNSEAVSSAAEG